MFKIKLEGFPNYRPFEAAIRSACEVVEEWSELAQYITRPQTRQAMVEWFGDADNGEVWANVGRLDKVIRDTGRTVTFVNAVGKVIRVQYNPNNIAQAPSFLEEAPDLSDMEGVAAWVYPTNTRDGMRSSQIGPGTPLFHTGSGMRLYLGYQTVMSATINHLELVQTIYHELSHKVIGTNDHEYGRDESKALIPDGRAVKNADNYGYFLLSVGS